MTKNSIEYLDEWIKIYTTGLSPANAAEAEHDDITTGLIGSKPLPLWRLREVINQLKDLTAITAKPSPLIPAPHMVLSGRITRKINGRHGTTTVHANPAEPDDADA